MYHVGFEAINDTHEDTIRYASFESLLIDQTNSNGIEDEYSFSYDGTKQRPKFTIPIYRSRNTFAVHVMNVAERILTAQMKGESTLHPLSLSPNAVRALYGI